jgi:methylated-DNA-[protein]-cysteine S-methyltransferase
MEFDDNTVERFIQSPLGFLRATTGPAGITSLAFIEESPSTFVTKSDSNPHLELLSTELDEYFAGTRKIFTVPLTPNGTDFQQQVWKNLHAIPFGETRTYHQQSQQLGNTLAIRAVAAANGRNPIAILIPCHRVIGANGNLTGYAGGLQRKKWLLDHERKYSGQSIQGSLFG